MALALVLPTQAYSAQARSLDRVSARSFAVYRMLGNDMWPLQGLGQMRRNSVYSATHEEKAPGNVPVYWVVNRIVNATERALLVSELKAAGVRNILYTSPPLPAMHCLSSPTARLLFAQAQNSVRNAMLEHAKTEGHEWAVPLDGNQFLPKGFYATMQAVFRQNEHFKRVAVLIPMLRVRQEQRADVLNAGTSVHGILSDHFTKGGDFLISEPQLALHTSRLASRGLSFDERSHYGSNNKASLVGTLCRRTGRDRMSLSTRCCEILGANVGVGGLSRPATWYSGGEVNLRTRVYDITRRRLARSSMADSPRAASLALTNPPGSGGISPMLRTAVLDEAKRLAGQCGVTLRLFNYPAEASLQHKIATDVRVRMHYRRQASKFLKLYIEAYLKHSTKPDNATCLKMTRKVTLVSIDPDTTTEEQAHVMDVEMERIKANITEEEVNADTPESLTGKVAESITGKEE
eukprot:CAMPEP_0181380026 /NCGR_PEP_ID=MMETSP1106-20121128/19318_1 /TAXON_ID=81844 /ORGANISM="Mantoniella antarctica, Strain SL-175" /LENGTH=462 /DNA_ID=CAMNT_0023499015 /DNA_START=130 /DNA_END=1515 /DNA_ORIENTATION=-